MNEQFQRIFNTPQVNMKLMEPSELFNLQNPYSAEEKYINIREENRQNFGMGLDGFPAVIFKSCKNAQPKSVDKHFQSFSRRSAYVKKLQAHLSHLTCQQYNEMHCQKKG